MIPAVPAAPAGSPADASPTSGEAASAFGALFAQAEEPGKAAAVSGKGLPVKEDDAAAAVQEPLTEDSALVVDPALFLVALPPPAAVLPTPPVGGAAATGQTCVPLIAPGQPTTSPPAIPPDLPVGSELAVPSDLSARLQAREQGVRSMSIDGADPQPGTVLTQPNPADPVNKTVAPPRTDTPVQESLVAVIATPAPRPQAGMPRLVTGRALRERAIDPSAAVPAAPSPGAAPAPAAAAPDIAQPVWPVAMAARIEALRDAADAVDTSIRILPDALGPVDVSVRREGEVTHVHLAAEQAQTARLLAEARPQLANLAEERGLKLATTTTGSGGGQADAQPRRPAPPLPAAPLAAPRRASAADPTHHRIA